MIRSVWVSVKFQREYDQGMVYDLSDPIPELPELPGQVEVCPDADVAAERLLTDFRHQADCCVRAFGDFHVALPGDACFGALYRRLLVDPLFRMLPWRKTHLWMLDAYGDGEPAADLIGGWLHDHTDLPREQWHPFRDEDPEAFDRELRENFAFREAGQDRLDFVLLPVREDGALPGADVDAPGAVNTSVGLALGFGALVRARMQAVACFGSDHIAPVLNRVGDGEALALVRPNPQEGVRLFYVDASAFAEASST